MIVCILFVITFKCVFLLSPSRDLTPVTAVDGRIIGEGVFGPMTRRLEAMYQDEIKTAVLAARKAS